MKIALSELKKALKWVDNHSPDICLNIEIEDSKLLIMCKDRYDVHVKISLYSDSSMLPKILKEDILRDDTK